MINFPFRVMMKEWKEEGDFEQDEESPSLLDIPVMSRAWIEIEDCNQS